MVLLFYYRLQLNSVPFCSNSFHLFFNMVHFFFLLHVVPVRSGSRSRESQSEYPQWLPSRFCCPVPSRPSRPSRRILFAVSPSLISSRMALRCSLNILNGVERSGPQASTFSPGSGIFHPVPVFAIFTH